MDLECLQICDNFISFCFKTCVNVLMPQYCLRKLSFICGVVPALIVGYRAQ